MTQEVVGSRFLNRRTVLRGTGLALSLPWLEAFQSSAVAAGSSGAPLRFVTFFQPNGVYPKAWDVTGVGKDYKLSTILEPLSDFRDQMSVLSGLDSVGQGHVQLTAAFLTGTPLKAGRNGVSLDQVIAKEIGQSTRFPSLELGTEPPRQGMANTDPIALANTVSWSSPTQRISPEISPRAAFDRIFRDASSPEVQREANSRRSILDLVMEDARSMQSKLSGRDRQKVDEYFEGLRSVELQVQRTIDPPTAEWQALTSPKKVRPPQGIPLNKEQHMRLMLDILVMALQTDVSRVATFMSAHGFSRQNFTFLDGVKNDHHGMSHHKNQESLVNEYVTVSRWYVEQVRYLVEKMRNINEGERSLFDNSIVLYGSEMKDGNGHIKQDLPLVLLGSGQGRINTGLHIKCNKNTPVANLHLTLAKKFGVKLSSFNGASSGEIVEL